VTSVLESKPRAPLSTIPQNHTPSTSSLEDIEDAEIIVVDTPERPVESLEDQFTQVEDEFQESKSTMDIDSDDDPTTEAEDDTDSEQTTSSKRLCIPSTTKLDREELRVVRNNFAEEYDPWDTSMVPEYAEDIFRYMRELEVHSPFSVLTTVPYDSQCTLYGESTGIRLAYASRPNRLVNPSPRPIPSPPRNSLPNCQHHRSIPHPSQRTRE
jgi:hypothetical protein